MEPCDVGAIMLIGKSKRLKRKAFTPVMGKELFRYALEPIEGIFDSTLVVCESGLEGDLSECVKKYALDSKIISESRGIGPLGGIYEGMENLDSDYVFVTGCDMPFFNACLVEFLCGEIKGADTPGIDGIVPRINGRIEPLHSIYRREKCMGVIESLIDLPTWSGRITDMIEGMDIKFIPENELRKYDPELLCFRNINLKEDIEFINEILETN